MRTFSKLHLTDNEIINSNVLYFWNRWKYFIKVYSRYLHEPFATRWAFLWIAISFPFFIYAYTHFVYKTFWSLGLDTSSHVLSPPDKFNSSFMVSIHEEASSLLRASEYEIGILSSLFVICMLTLNFAFSNSNHVGVFPILFLLLRLTNESLFDILISLSWLSC